MNELINLFIYLLINSLTDPKLLEQRTNKKIAFKLA